MPTISQLPPTESVTSSDAMPISQSGVAHSATIGTLLASTQPAIIVDSGMLLGRVSLGPGGPEGITVGSGLIINAATLQTTNLDYTSLPIATGLDATDSVVVTNGGTNPQLMMLSQLRGLFSAGNDVTITPSGVISATTPSDAGTSSTYSISALPPTAIATAQDLVGISQAGTDHAIAYANLINGQTIDTAQPASAASDGDSFWVAQGGSTMVSQTFSAIWPWIETKLVSFKPPSVEITVNTTIDGTVHNARVLICSQPVTMTPITANMGNGFYCDIVNLSSGPVAFNGTIVTSSGTLPLAPGQAMTLRCLTYSGGTVLFAFVGNATVTASVPGAVVDPTSSAQTTNSIVLTWGAPVTGAAATGYIVEYRLTGSTSWNIVAQTVSTPPYTISDLSSGTSYDFRVSAINASGSGVISSMLTVATLSAGNSPAAVAAFATGNPTPTSIQLTWQVPSSGGPPTSYTVQYRMTGTTSWSGVVPGISTMTQEITGLSPSTSYDFCVYAVNAGGAGPISPVVTASTTTQAGLVTAIVWNVAPSGTYTHGSGSIGVNAHVAPASAMVQFGFSTSMTAEPSLWTAGVNVNSDLWGAYVPTPPTAGTWYAWAAGTDGSAATPYQTAFTVI